MTEPIENLSSELVRLRTRSEKLRLGIKAANNGTEGIDFGELSNDLLQVMADVELLAFGIFHEQQNTNGDGE